jgi:small-conductance mechanosensitive channel/CRP-like cAMP-binding protein
MMHGAEYGGTSGAELLLATLVLVVVAVVVRIRPQWPLWLIVALRLAAFLVLTFLIRDLVGSPLEPRFASAFGNTTFWEHVIEAGWWLSAAGLAIGLVRLLVVLEHRPRETEIISDLIAGAIGVATLLAIVNFALGVPIAGLLATSGVIAIVLGLALQNTLADVFSGIAVDVERPYKVGDLLWVEGDIEGHVTQVTWRSTHIATGQGNIAVVPNSVMAKARLVNRSLPVPSRFDTIDIKLDPMVSPERCLDVLTTATRAARLPMASPAPTVTCTSLVPDGVCYQITYAVASSDALPAARSEMLTQLHRHLSYVGIGFAGSPGSTQPVSPTPPTLLHVLANSDLLKALQTQQQQALASRFREVWLDRDETLFLEGCVPEYLFLIASGVVEVCRQHPSGREVLQRLSPGECAGAIGVITSCVYTASATTITPVRAFRLSRADLFDAMATVPGLETSLRAAVRSGKRTSSQELAAKSSDTDQPGEDLATRFHDFLHLLAR